ncbi:HXXXD-type acyl-transferase family protein [Hibiscus syriacus]|uniref:HXXXD-type acyl-transferase family protein n=1 Tax=Hibiscus syriacus TaxID=106335 RepID=A0A6A3C228_HIBSY|nr:HXXXD-type acyl-transferase family protein [Hibiscus syriacus]
MSMSSSTSTRGSGKSAPIIREFVKVVFLFSLHSCFSAELHLEEMLEYNDLVPPVHGEASSSDERKAPPTNRNNRGDPKQGLTVKSSPQHHGDLNDPRVRFKKDCVGIMAAFKLKHPPHHVVVLANTHLYWDPKLVDVKLAQARYLLARLAQFKTLVTGRFKWLDLPDVSGGFPNCSHPSDHLPIGVEGKSPPTAHMQCLFAFYNLNQSLVGTVVPCLNVDEFAFPVQVQVTCRGLSVTFTFDHVLGGTFRHTSFPHTNFLLITFLSSARLKILEISVDGNKRMKTEAFLRSISDSAKNTHDAILKATNEAHFQEFIDWIECHKPGLMLPRFVLGREGPALDIDIQLLNCSPVLGMVSTAIKNSRAGYMNQKSSARATTDCSIGVGFSFTTLKDSFRFLDYEDASDDEVKQYARACILQLIGGLLMPDKSHNQVHCMWLQHLGDFYLAGSLSWGSAVLACLYREMCRAIDYMQLIRISATPEFEWVSYSTDDVRAVIPPELRGPLDVWMAIVPLICYATVEWHSADRVLRQFGCFQPIPEAPRNMDELHSTDRCGKTDTDWLVRHHANEKPFLIPEDARGQTFPRRRQRCSPTQHHRPPTRGLRASASGSSSVAPAVPSQQPPYPPACIPQPYMILSPTFHYQIPPSPPSPAFMTPPSPSQMTPPRGYYGSMFVDLTWGSYTRYLAGSDSSPMAAAQTPPVQFLHSTMFEFYEFSQFSQAGGIVSHIPPGSLFYGGASSSSTPHQQNVVVQDDDDDDDGDVMTARSHNQ